MAVILHKALLTVTQPIALGKLQVASEEEEELWPTSLRVFCTAVTEDNVMFPDSLASSHPKLPNCSLVPHPPKNPEGKSHYLINTSSCMQDTAFMSVH